MNTFTNSPQSICWKLGLSQTVHRAYPCTSAWGLLSPWLPFKPTVLSLQLHSSTDLVSDSFLSLAPSDSTPFLPGHLFITSAVGGERVRRCLPKTFRSMSMGAGDHFHRTRKILQKVLRTVTTILAQNTCKFKDLMYNRYRTNFFPVPVIVN